MTPSREEKERGRETTPRLADTTPQVFPSGDYSYVVEIVMRMQDTMGQLREAVTSLKEQSKNQGEKLDQIGKDVHAAKVTMRFLAAIILGGAGLIGWVVTTYIRYVAAHK